jgi:hypothetical protein
VAIAQINPAMILMVIATILVLKKNDKMPWTRLNRRMVRDVTATSDTWLVMPMTNEK